MPRTNVLLYRDDDGTVPILEWLDGLPPKAQDKCRVKIERLRELGHELRRPEADFLRDGIYELRVRLQRINYRMLYFFHGIPLSSFPTGLSKKSEFHPRKSTGP
jgi:phage-related protein